MTIKLKLGPEREIELSLDEAQAAYHQLKALSDSLSNLDDGVDTALQEFQKLAEKTKEAVAPVYVPYPVYTPARPYWGELGIPWCSHFGGES
jgi:hypothetical protein